MTSVSTLNKDVPTDSKASIMSQDTTDDYDIDNLKTDSTVSCPPEPIAIRPDHIAETETKLIIKAQDTIYQYLNFLIRREDGSVLYTVEGSMASWSSRRSFRDASGLPLFELRRHYMSFGKCWYIQLPGGGSKDLMRGSFKMYMLHTKFDIIIQNMASSEAVEGKGPEVRLQVRGQNASKKHFDVLLDGQKVIHIRRTNSVFSSAKNVLSRAEWEVTVAKGMDMTIASLAVLIIAELRMYGC